MSKKVFTIVGLVLIGIATFGIGSALSIGISFGTAFGSVAAGAGFLSAFTLGQLALAGVAILGASNALRSPTFDISSEVTARLAIGTDANAGRNVIVGEIDVAGTLRYRNTFDLGEKQVMWAVMVLSGYPVDSLQSFTLNGESVTLVDPTGTGAVTGKFAGKLFVFFRDGRATTPAFPQIKTDEEATFGVGNSIWDGNTRVGRGMATAAIKAIPDEDFNGRLEPVFRIRGARMYDPRLDTTRGGSGSHRYDDETTFEWSNVGVDQLAKNPAIAKLNFLRGFWWPDSAANEQLIVGRGLKDDPDRIDFASVIEAANICDEDVGVEPSGTIDRYTANGLVNPESGWDRVLVELDTADGGNTVYSGGQYRFYPAVYRAPTLTFTEADIIGVPSRVDFAKGPSERVNVVRGGFADETNGYQLRDYPSQKDTASIARVGERQLTLNFPFTTDHRIAQRIAKIAQRQQNSTRAMSAQFTHRALKLAPGGEAIAITYPLYQFTAQAMRIAEWELVGIKDKQGAPGLAVDMALVEDDSAFYSWAFGTDEQAIGAPDLLPPTSPRKPVETTFAVVINTDADGGTQLGEVVVTGVDINGQLDFTKDGSIRWNGQRIIIPRDSGDGFTFAGGGIGRRTAWLLFDTEKPGTPRFTAAGQARHTVIAYRDQSGRWFYDDNAAPVAFTPIRNRDVALGWVEVDGDNILDGSGFAPRSIDLVSEARSDRTAVGIPHVSLNAIWIETFDGYASEDDFLRNWELISGTPTITLPEEGRLGGRVLNVVGEAYFVWRGLIPYDAARLRFAQIEHRRIVADASNEDLEAGFLGVAPDGVTLIDRLGADSTNDPARTIAKTGTGIAAVPLDEWKRHFSWFVNTINSASFVETGGVNVLNPNLAYQPLHIRSTASLRPAYIKPWFKVNSPATSTAECQIDNFIVAEGFGQIFNSPPDPGFSLFDDLWWHVGLATPNAEYATGEGRNLQAALKWPNISNIGVSFPARFLLPRIGDTVDIIVGYKIQDHAAGIDAGSKLKFFLRIQKHQTSPTFPERYLDDISGPGTTTEKLISTLIVDNAWHQVTFAAVDISSISTFDEGETISLDVQVLSAAVADDFTFWIDRLVPIVRA